MLSRPLLATLLATLLAAAPTGLWAFEAMDCIGTEFCTDEGCTPSSQIYAVDFDWATDSVTLTTQGDTLTTGLRVPATEALPTPGQLAYIAPEGTGLWPTFSGADIAMELFTGTPGATHHAICATREAA